MLTLTTRLFAAADLPEALQALVTRWDQTCFTVPNDYQWARPQWHIFVEADGMPVSYTGLFMRDCTLAGRPLRLAGVGSVMTPPAHRGQGYASAGLVRANRAMREVVAAPFGLLVTDAPLIPFYARFGWQPLPDPMIVALPDGTSGPYAGEVMIQPLGAASWPGGLLDLCGFPW